MWPARRPRTRTGKTVTACKRTGRILATWGQGFLLLTLIMIILAGMMPVTIVMLSLNHYFYMQRRLTDVRLEAIHEVNWLLAQFLTNCTAERDYVPSENFLQSFRAATAKTRALFSGTTCQIFRRIEAMVDPNLGALPGRIDPLDTSSLPLPGSSVPPT